VASDLDTYVSEEYQRRMDVGEPFGLRDIYDALVPVVEAHPALLDRDRQLWDAIDRVDRRYVQRVNRGSAGFNARGTQLPLFDREHGSLPVGEGVRVPQRRAHRADVNAYWLLEVVAYSGQTAAHLEKGRAVTDWLTRLPDDDTVLDDV
jgi:hypothetical protein